MSTPRSNPDTVTYQETVTGGRYWSMVIRRGFRLRLTDLNGRANVGMLLFNPHNLLERYNMSDTLKGQHTAKLTRGNMLYSDMGRTLMSVVEDSVGWHDTIGGFSDAQLVRKKYGEASYQAVHNDFYRNGRELFLIELAKWGLGKADLVPNLNLFSKVAAGADGTLSFHPHNSQAGDQVTLRADMDVLVVLNTAQHPMDPAAQYAPGPVSLEILNPVSVSTEDDYCIQYRPENARAWANTQIYHCQEPAL
jgi:uncharacterized protein